MNSGVAAITSPLALARDRVMAYYELNKPRVLTMVLITTLAGFYMGSGGPFDFADALKVLAGTALAAGGTLALNQYFERDTDAMMVRTRDRPLPSGRLAPIEALLFGLLTSVAGLVFLWRAVNPLSATVTGAITFLYLAAYTPMKRYSWMCHVVGAVPGALPPLIGWAAARDSLSAQPWVLFGIMFLWQLPHSLSIARIYQEDYARAGMSLLPRERPYGNPANLLMLTATIVLVAFGTLPTWMGFAGWIYLGAAVILGAMMLYHSVRLVRSMATEAGARRVMMLSLIYLPAVLLVMVLDKV
ncbi:MAG TPA: heme o synthase [Candidatus Binataceae bacterium]|nr:heme o synthase [Candidatus Binataceae bacterium]